jgi:hypothetical protein
MSFDGDDLDDAIDSLEDMGEKAEELHGENEVPIVDLFTDDFMEAHTDFGSLDEFFEQSPWEVESEQDIEAIPQDEMDDYVAENTDFPHTDGMTSKAGSEWAAKQLGFSRK